MTNKPRQNPIKMRVIVVGPKGVGKSACIVKFLTNKFLYDYSSKQDNSYHNQVTLEETIYDLDVTDITKHNSSESLPVTKCEMVDAFVVVYSIDNRWSFDEASGWHQKLEARFPDSPILLLANKCDMAYAREVDAEEGKELAGELFFEVSAAESESTALNRAFAALFRRVVQLRNCQTVKRKLSMTKKIGSIFTRKDSARRISTSASM
ncbi:ras-like protein family member 11B [Varroa jacobsoni]|uniref:small monomeric GTPase n=1 Tax=Varroa destructor TaxID=109461 RepID=A0A7M7JB91_VARDE|nr:ras-like protein family member 11B [Varroa destructor]XP_022703896.1 ras-like protein family member 11B [Varroa jacobsoni]